MWKKLRYVALIATVLTPIAHIHTCCCGSDDLLPPPVDFYEIYENTPADCNESERGKEQKRNAGTSAEANSCHSRRKTEQTLTSPFPVIHYSRN